MLCFPVSSGQRKIRALESSGRRKERGWHLCTLITNLLVSDDRWLLLHEFLWPLQTEKADILLPFFPSPLHYYPWFILFFLELVSWALSILYHLSITFHCRFLCRTGKDRGSDADDTLCYPERLGGIPLWGDCQRGPRQPRRGDCNPQCAWYDGKPVNMCIHEGECTCIHVRQ